MATVRTWFLALVLALLASTAATFGQVRPLVLVHGCSGVVITQFLTSECARIQVDLFEGLLRIGPEGTVEPGVAENWDVDWAGRRIVFHLRKDRRWSDGEPVVAEDFITGWQDTFRRYPNHASSWFFAKFEGAKAFISGATDHISGLRAPDPLTLELTFDEFDPIFPTRQANGFFMPAPAHFIRRHGPDWFKRLDVPTNGFYTFPQQSEGATGNRLLRIVLRANPHHPEAHRVKIPQVDYRYGQGEAPTVTGANIRETLLSTYAPDMVRADFSNDPSIVAFVGNSGWKLYSIAEFSTAELLLNTSRVSANVVEAIKNIVDSDEYVARNAKLFGKPARRLFDDPQESIAPKEGPGGRATSSPSERHTKAVDYLARDGISPQRRKSLNLQTMPSSTPESINSLISMLKDYGLDLVPHYFEDAATFYTQSPKVAGADAALVLWHSFVPDRTGQFATFSWIWFPVLSPDNQARFNQLLGNAANARSMSERDTQLRRAEDLLLGEGGVIPLFHPQRQMLLRAELCGFKATYTRNITSAWLNWCSDR